MDVKISVQDVVLETERLLLRSFQESDLEDFFEYASVPGVGEMAGWVHHQAIEASKKILDSFIAENEVYAIVHKANNKVIGSLGLHQSWANEEDEYKDLRLKEIGYVLSKKYWGRGLMPEAVKKVIAYYFENNILDAFTVSHFSFNNQSKRVIEKCGFEYVKTTNVHLKQLQKTYENLKYILIKKG
ncbi:MAG TPA: GNAT family N-acetyltransferase [Bacilli bacterium]